MSGRLRLDALIRVSQQDGRSGDEFRSPGQQREICEQWAAGNGARIIAWHEAIDVSGKTVVRADVDYAVARIRSGATDGVIVAWLDRFSRAPVGEALRVYDDIRQAGGRVVACDMAGIQPDDPTGELALTVMLAVNRMQWRRIAERWAMNRRDAIRAGKAIGGAPFGYRFTDPTPRQRGRGVANSRLFPHEQHAAGLLELFERKAGGATWLELARWLDEAAPKPDGRCWARSTVTGIIRRRTYLGEVSSGEHVQAAAHEAIVPVALWRRAQGEPGRRTPRGTYLLSGLVRCSGCSRRMRATSGGRGRKPAAFLCITPECSLRYLTVVVARLDAEVTRQFFAHLDDFHTQAVNDADIAEAQAEAERLRGNVERLAVIIPAHPAAVAAHQSALADAELSLNDAEDNVHQLLASREHADPDVRQLRDDWDGLVLAEQREILRAGIDTVLIRRASGSGPAGSISKRILVLFREQAPAQLAHHGPTSILRGWAWDDQPGSLRATT